MKEVELRIDISWLVEENMKSITETVKFFPLNDKLKENEEYVLCKREKKNLYMLTL